ncbi:MAG: hypothetical protein COA96_05960 [SAR86 cluster bacterium]|uniref:Uncharacterized protein n=1 Tax=SAR86 cluster bacterium TaxID=2030880 RepID=A0A2A5B3D2_9GAMM|nr:MAG: hypothetical protein COA96_05960 [SAR86 cluster bacterium]
MRLITQSKLILTIAAFLFSTLSAELVLAADDEQRAPPTARTAGTLGTQVMRAITSISELMTPEDPEDEPDLVGAKEELDELFDRRYERMNDYEKSTTLSFFTNYYLAIEDYPGAIRYFELTLTIDELREDIRLRVLRSLGQLHMAEENWQDAIKFYQMWRDLSIDEDIVVYRGLSYAHYQQEDFPGALPFWRSFMDLKVADGEALSRDDYSYLNGLYFNMEDYESALGITKTLIVLFDERADWVNLSAIYGSLEDYEHSVQALNLFYLKGFFEGDTRYKNLGQSLAGNDQPFSGAKIIQEGMDKDIVEQDLSNLTTLTQMLLIASEFESALEPAIKAAELDDTGNGYDEVGYIQYMLKDYEGSAEALELAVEKGGLDDKSDTLYFLARAHLELRNFDDARDAASDSAEAGDERARETGQNFMKVVESRRTYYATIASRKADAIDFYRPYPPLQ